MPARPSEICLRLNIEALCAYLDAEKPLLPEPDEVHRFLDAVNKYGKHCSSTGEFSLSLEELKKSLLDPACPKFYRERLSSPFVQLSIFKNFSNAYFRVPVEDFQLVVETINDYVVERWKLTAYAATNGRILGEKDMNEYLTAFIREYANFPEEDVDYALCIYRSKFSFCLDGAGTSNYQIKDLLSSGLVREMRDSLALDSNNWFSKTNLLRILGEFQALDTNQDGLLNYEELKAMEDVNPEFVYRLCQKKMSFENDGIDFGAFCTYRLAMDNPHCLATCRYLFDIFDGDGDGLLTIEDLRALLVALRKKLYEREYMDIPKSDDVLLAEMLDCVGCADLQRMSLKQICRSGLAHVFLRIFVNTEEFINYDLRETEPEKDPAGPISSRLYP
ncbi:unnamed protein product, partial [Mesorhabditis spiculigera]